MLERYQAEMKVIFRLLGNRWMIFIVITIMSRYVIGSVFDVRARCESGWVSPSIGERGACSHHGGVDRTRPSLASLASLIIGFGCAFGPSILREEKERRLEEATKIADAEKANRENEMRRIKEQADLEAKRKSYPGRSEEDIREYDRLLKLAWENNERQRRRLEETEDDAK